MIHNNPVDVGAGLILDFTRDVLGVELTEWQAESLEGLLLNYGRAIEQGAQLARRTPPLASEPGPVPEVPRGGEPAGAQRDDIPGWMPPQDDPERAKVLKTVQEWRGTGDGPSADYPGRAGG